MLFDYIELRRYFHKYPELSFEEYNTSEKIQEVLGKLEIPYSANIAETGVVGLLKGKNDKKTIVIRADMDALPVNEVNECEYTSLNKGVMHACGHDVHIATVLCAAEKISRKKDDLNGCVKFVFQPGEETTGGALPMIRSGILENPKADVCVGFHVKPELEPGKIICSSGKQMASPDEFRITLQGHGGHCAYPDQNDNLIKIASELIIKLSELSYPDAIIVPCVINAGKAFNVMSSELKLAGSFRTFDESTRTEISETIKRIVSDIASKYSISADCEIVFSYPPLKNDEGATTIMQKAAISVLGEDNVIKEYEPSMLGEDFSYFGQFAPSVYFYLGTKLKDKETILHANNFDVDESAIEIGASILQKFVLDFLK